jgi:hypothetical protein
MIKRFFTSNYDKRPTSNVSKVISIVSEELDELKTLYQKVEEYNDVDKAEGVALDTIGANIGQYRGEVRDEVYRALIKTKILRNRSDGTLNDIVEVLSIALDIDKTDIIMREDTESSLPNINVLTVPIEALIRTGMTASQLGKLVNSMVVAGVKMEGIVYGGTFEYTDELGNDVELGYADVGMNNGGTLGDAYAPSEEDRFPI